MTYHDISGELRGFVSKLTLTSNMFSSIISALTPVALKG